MIPVEAAICVPIRGSTDVTGVGLVDATIFAAGTVGVVTEFASTAGAAGLAAAATGAAPPNKLPRLNLFALCGSSEALTIADDNTVACITFAIFITATLYDNLE